MKKRILKVTIGKAGGNASKASKKYLMTIPNAWAQQMKIEPNDRTFVAEFDGEKIIIKKEKK